MKINSDLIKDKSNEKVIKKNYNFDDTNDNFFQQKTMAGQSTIYDPNSTKNEMNNTKTTENKQNNIILHHKIDFIFQAYFWYYRNYHSFFHFLGNLNSHMLFRYLFQEP